MDRYVPTKRTHGIGGKCFKVTFDQSKMVKYEVFLFIYHFPHKDFLLNMWKKITRFRRMSS